MSTSCVRVGIALGLLGTATLGTQAQEPEGDAMWFGVARPPALAPHSLGVLRERPAVSALVPVGEEAFPDLTGDSIRALLETIVSFSQESRRTGEIGDGQLWGRVSGFPSGAKTVQWATDELRAAGITDVELQPFSQENGASIWLPLAWEVSLVGDAAFGAGTVDALLDSAMPLSAAGQSVVELTAPLVHVGTASAAELAHVDVRGKVAVQKVIPQGHSVFVRNPVAPRSQTLIALGAVAVLRVIDLPGNHRARDIGCGGGVCFNLGGRDGHFLESVMNAAAEATTLDRLRLRMRLVSEEVSGLSAANAVAVISGATQPEEFIVINAHADAWFDGAGDNGDGLAVLVALARHFGAPERRLDRSLVFVASAGHHTPGLNGPRHFLAMNPDIVAGTRLVINLEHTAQRHITPARSTHVDGYREWVMDSREAPIVAGVSDLAPFYEDLVQRGITRYGTNFVAAANPMASGEGGPYRRAGLPVFTAMQGSPMYHTTGEVLEMVSTPGLERMARFMSYLVGEVSRAAGTRLNPK